MDDKKRVLVTTIGTVNGSTVVEELKKSKEYYVIGANCTPKEYVVTSKFVDEYYKFPMVVENKEFYLSFVLNFCKEHAIDHIICFIDEEVELFTRNRDKFTNIGVKLCLPDYSVVSICHFKNNFSEWIEKYFPEIWIKEYKNVKDNVEELKFPLFVKPYEGRASIGCKKIDNNQELQTFLKENNNGNGFLFQENIDGYVIGVDIVRNKKYNQICIVQKKELMRNSNGCGTVVEIVNLPIIEEICKEIALKLDLNGIINTEFFMTKSGPKIIEINPRIPAGTSYSCLAGGNTVINSILIADEKQCEFDQIKFGKTYARRYETYEM